MALRCFIGTSCSRVQDDVILPRAGEPRFFEAPDRVILADICGVAVKLFKRASWMLLGNAVYAAAQAMNLVVISRLSGPESAGLFSLALSLCAPLMLFSNFGMRAQVMTDVSSSISPDDYKLMRRVLALTGFSVCCVAAGFLQHGYVSFIVIVLIALSKAIESQADLVYGVLQRTGMHRSIALSLIAKGVAGLAGMAVTFSLGGDLIAAAVAYVLCWAASYVFYDVPVSKNVFKVMADGNYVSRSSAIKSIVRLGLPYGLASLCIAGGASVPRIVLSEYSDLAVLGIFATLAGFVQAGTLLVNSTGQAFGPRLAKNFQEGNKRQFLRLVIVGAASATFFAICGLALSIPFGKWATQKLVGSVSGSMDDILFWMFFAAIPQYVATFLGHVVSATRKNTNLFYVQFFALAVSIAASFVTIPRYGAYGAIQATALVSSLVVAMYASVIFRSFSSSSRLA